MELLPDDALADVLRRLPPRSLAVSRCVCSSWRALIDGDGMLRTDLLPHSLAGLVICYRDQEFGRAMLLARPGVVSDSDGYAIDDFHIQDHCNGLLLLNGSVRNPATGRYATLPERVETDLEDQLEYEFLAFDPAVSPHYEVVMVPYVVPPEPPGDVATLDSEWPPSPWILTVFSSATGLWEERSFIRQGEPAAGTVADLLPGWWADWRLDGHAEYWRGALYVHCETNFVMRISLSHSTYKVIKPPRSFEDDQEFVIGKSEKGIYSAFLDDKCRLWIWTLDESCDDQIRWKLRHDSGRGIAFTTSSLGRGAWMLSDRDQDDEAQVDQKFEWNSDDDDGNTIEPTGAAEACRNSVQVVAFHPYREIVFFHISEERAAAYHLSTSKLEVLGGLSPATPLYSEYIRNYFPFTPCYIGELPKEYK